ncbi:hypothetical protein EML15_06145 [Corynebacterium sp. sy017]|uniref:DUF4259 domain-containing protein n=1 Tax=unclassified Corynebacterium TaxID=2624378 RepID=UPI001186A31C|nr:MULTISPECIES: DUF4259 domain-containing protein [unclassified Corynebacterium]MBP3088730.1 hypothetical protein [Corynebacterium sp. sy017]QDZ42125.1 hypothetical protein FQV43_02265 [Corynebacterium sp. sy039]TSD92013.1 hypothetical protein ELY17_06145 [Corynebacterium sp. SY003]
MSAWERNIFNEEVNIDFLEELNDLDEENVVEAIFDAVMLVRNDVARTEEEQLNGQAAATIAAIWAGAPYSSGEIIAMYPFIRDLIGAGDEQLRESAAAVLETVETDDDLESYIEALS